MRPQFVTAWATVPGERWNLIRPSRVHVGGLGLDLYSVYAILTMSPSYRIRFYRSARGGCQACDYARAMDIAHQAKAKRWFKALAVEGPRIPSEYGKLLRDGVWELRIIAAHHQHRFMYCYWGGIIVVTNAFLKKSWAVPEAEIERSRAAMADWVRRRGWEEI